MTFTVVTTFPKEDTVNREKHTTLTHKETLYDQTIDNVVSLYNDYERSGYKVSESFDTTEVDEKTPFEIAHELEQSGVEYVAKLQFLDKTNQGTYEHVFNLSQKLERYGYDKYRIDIQLKIHDESTVDLKREQTWFNDTDTLYKLTPDVKSKNIDELLSLYNDCNESGYHAHIIVKPKIKADESDMYTRLSVFPNGTTVKFTLSDAD